MRSIVAAGVIIFTTTLSAQTDSFIHDGVYRSYIVHTPNGWQPGDTVPLVINMHGFGTTAQAQQLYSLMDFVADTAGFIVVYPQGISNSWDFTGFSTDDLGFIDKLIDTIHMDYGVDLDRVYACGISNGGFMSYTLACELSDRIVAIASVAASMSILQTFSCSPSRPVPVFELHGTDDTLVPYGGGFGVEAVEDAIAGWRSRNGCTPQVDSFDFIDIIPFDGCTVTAFKWSNCDDESEVWLYRINGGGHTWPGTFPVPPLGPTNLDIVGSVHIWEFFRKYRFESQPPTVNGQIEPIAVKLAPNPADDFVRLHSAVPVDAIQLFDLQGRPVPTTFYDNTMSVAAVPDGCYVVDVRLGTHMHRELIVVQH